MIVKDPNPVLHRECKSVLFKNARQLEKDLAKAYEDYQKTTEMHVVGMAAPQIGKPVRAFYAFGHIFINPTIVGRSEYEITVTEGCCSLPDKEVAQVKRSNKVVLHYFGKNRQFFAQEFEGSYAAVIQHEVDHLDGILISDKAELKKLPKNASLKA